MDGRPEALEHVQRTYGDLLNTITPAESAAASQHTALRTIQAATTATPLASIPDDAIAAAKQADDGFSAPLNIFSSDEQVALRNAGLVYNDNNYNGAERVKVDPLFEEGDRRMKAARKAKAEAKASAANINQVKTQEETKGHESTQSKNQQKPDEGTKNQDQHAEPEPRKVADTQREAEAREVSATKKAADEGGHTVRELAPGYKTESGKPLSEADEKEFILKPDGSNDFGEITDAISKTAKEQHNVELAPGKIRLRVGNEIEGLRHAKEHENQAKADGYASIEDMIADVTENFDEIYERKPNNENGHVTYSLVKRGNKATGKMNGVSPIYFELQHDGNKGYYIVVSAIPKGDKSLKRGTAKDRLIYSSPGLGAATQSNAGAVSHDSHNVGAVNRGGSPTSDKSSGSSTHIIPHEQKEGTKNLDDIPAGLSKEAHGVYTAVRDKLRTSKSERARRAADVSAETLARHADAYAKAYSKATGKKYTAADYMRDKIGIDMDGNVVNDEKAKTFFQTVWHGSPHDFDQFNLGAIGTGEGYRCTARACTSRRIARCRKATSSVCLMSLATRLPKTETLCRSRTRSGRLSTMHRLTRICRRLSSRSNC